MGRGAEHRYISESYDRAATIACRGRLVRPDRREGRAPVAPYRWRV
ncbi:hypothetical protein AvCA_08500 [Azotobacter vinelandii CA]|uniref:Uncharacterized protein n=2 Tax=Azotobacter vinelandii TaxID=354 RepID=C1DMR5_AZOVD|nr:hypothetical protein Avin_08500 [Azotobacter vinelandii DJ]AGK15490.1 hypothetical protein AvCA_08500 [Azotobacter vinelandii CA]AGK19559.1 hypothetical protein AvCA6_08500 [Azotobacter vinelandii CA6]